MERETIAKTFYIDDHALIFGLLGKHAEACCGPVGMEALNKGTIQYARERGIRMAKRCLADGRPLTMRNYLLYGEWTDPRGWTNLEVAGIVPDCRNHVEHCGWNDTWRKYGLLRYGAVYCTWTDKNLVYGFNPALEIGVEGLLTHDAPSCEFHWMGTDFREEQEFYDLMAEKKTLAPRTVRDFLYHTGHMLSALRRTYYTELGVPAAEEICARALADYEAVMGPEKRAALEAESGLDFFAI